jgi:C4-type Zn-finger protein
MDVVKFECDDKYEAEKLAWLLGMREDSMNFMQGVAAVVENEIVVILKDRSSHSILMKDHASANRLKEFVEDLLLQKKTIHEISFVDHVTKICTC